MPSRICAIEFKQELAYGGRSLASQRLATHSNWSVYDSTLAAYSIAALLQERGKQIVPIHPAAAAPEGLEVLGERGYPTLADVPFPIDVVDVFRRSDAAGEFADQAVAVGAKGVWFQLGVIDADAFDRTVAAGVPMVMDTCPAIEWRRR